MHFCLFPYFEIHSHFFFQIVTAVWGFFIIKIYYSFVWVSSPVDVQKELLPCKYHMFEYISGHMVEQVRKSMTNYSKIAASPKIFILKEFIHSIMPICIFYNISWIIHSEAKIVVLNMQMLI